MKLFSLKALALAFVVVTGSAQATFTKTVKDYVKKADETLFGKYKKLDDENRVIHGFRPFSTLNYYTQNKLAHAAVVVAAATAISTAIYKTYKHFTNPAADATEEGEIVEANETTTEVA